MKTKFCLPIIKNATKEVEETIKTYFDKFDMFEVWINYMNDFTTNFIDDLINKYPNKIILVLRTKNNDVIKIKKDKQIDILLFCRNKKIFIDLDIDIQKNELDFIKTQKISLRLITSFHDYKTTPRTNKLVKVIERMTGYNPEIYKISTFCKSPYQAIALMHLLLDVKEQNKKAIILGMGINGKLTRIFGSLYGNEITFAPEVINEQSASGQLTRIETKEIVSILERGE